MTTRNETLYYFPAAETDVGVMPSFYDVARSPADCREMEKHGGRVSESWAAYEETLRAYDESIS